MKYVAIFIAVLFAFIAGTQISNANSMVVKTAVQQTSASLTKSMASEYLISDTANRMMAYHKAYNK